MMFRQSASSLPLLAALSCFLSTVVVVVEGYGPKTEGMKKQERFFQCILAIEEADVNHDDMISRYEFQPFVQFLSTQMFEEQVIEDGELPRELARLYPHLVAAAEGEIVGKGKKNIDVFGARMDELQEISSARLNVLHTICEMTMHELSMLGPQTDAPVLMMDMMETEEEFEKGNDPDEPQDDSSSSEEGDAGATGFGVSEKAKTQGDLDFEYAMNELNTEMISVHSSFVIANMHSIHWSQLDLHHTGLLHKAYVDFITRLMDHLCHSGTPCPNDESELELSQEEFKQHVEEWKKGGVPQNYQHKVGDHEHVGREGHDPEKEEEEIEGWGDYGVEVVKNSDDEEGSNHTRRSLLFFAEYNDYQPLPEVMDNHRRLCKGDKPTQSICTEDANGRRLMAAATLEDAELYEVKEFECPLEVRQFSNEHYHGLLPQCATIYGHYDVLVTHMHLDIQHVEQNYVTATSAAILRGKLQEALMRVDRHNKFTFEILGPGHYRYPHENTHHAYGEASTKHGEDARNGHGMEGQKKQQLEHHESLHVGLNRNPEQAEEKREEAVKEAAQEAEEEELKKKSAEEREKELEAREKAEAEREQAEQEREKEEALKEKEEAEAEAAKKEATEQEQDPVDHKKGTGAGLGKDRGHQHPKYGQGGKKNGKHLRH